MDTKAHYTLIGLIVVILFSGIVTTALWLSVGLDRPVYNTFLVYMDQSITGLNQEAAVKYNGVTVGYVQSMALNPKNPQEVILDLQIKEGTPITTSTVATLTPQGVTGLAFIGLSANTPNAPLVKPHQSPPYPIIPSEPSLLVQISTILKDASTQFQGISTSIQNILSPENAKSIQSILVNLDRTTQNLATNSTKLNKIMSQVDVIAHNTAKASENFPATMQNINQSIRNLNQTSNLAKQAMIPGVRLLNHLDSISGNLEVFSNELKQNPAILIRGKAVSNLGPGE